MYEDSCPHGYIPSSCAECRRGTYGEHSEIVSPVGDPVEERFKRYLARHKDGQRAGWLTRRSEITAELAKLEGYAHRSNAQDEQLDELTGELTVLGSLIDQDDVRVRSETIARGRELAKDPANCESVDGGTRPYGGAPALVTSPGTRIESPQETLQRMRSDPWRGPDGDPLAGHTSYGRPGETAAGFVARANTALEGLEERLTRPGAELLSTLLSERRDTRGVSVRRSADEVRDAAEMIVALSSPFYESAMRSVFRNPDMFATGLGAMVWSDDERQAVHAVMNNTACRAAFAETSGAVGAFALPLQLDDTILFTNAGIASPHRSLARHELGTSNTWNGITSAGATANWVAEGTAVTDTTPAIGQLVITPYKMMTWIFGSFEVLDDTSLSEQVPRLFEEARGRLEGSAFAIGTGTAQPFGAVTRAGADASAGALTNTMIYNLDQNLPPRFRNGGRVAWAANESIRNVARQVAKFTGAVESIVNDNTADGIPEMLGYDFYESSAMLGGSVGNRELLLGDWSSYIIVDRLPSVVVAEPLVMSQATALPTGQRGWLNYSRVGADTVTQGAAFGSNAFVVHVH
jgi:HK97 family phage major capsid protein